MKSIRIVNTTGMVHDTQVYDFNSGALLEGISRVEIMDITPNTPLVTARITFAKAELDLRFKLEEFDFFDRQVAMIDSEVVNV